MLFSKTTAVPGGMQISGLLIYAAVEFVACLRFLAERSSRVPVISPSKTVNSTLTVILKTRRVQRIWDVRIFGSIGA